MKSRSIYQDYDTVSMVTWVSVVVFNSKPEPESEWGYALHYHECAGGNGLLLCCHKQQLLQQSFSGI